MKLNPLAAFAALAAMIGGGAMTDIQRVFPTVGMNLGRGSRKCRSHTKKGPGRVHMQGDGSKEARRKSRHIVFCTNY